jgi:hypothetical protein
MQDRRASLFDEDTPCVGELHTDNPAIIASEQTKSMLIFDLSDLSAERRLGKMQSVGGLREVQLFGQDNDCVQVTDIEIGEHCSKPQAVDTSLFVPRGSPYSDRFLYSDDCFSL